MTAYDVELLLELEEIWREAETKRLAYAIAKALMGEGK